MHNNNSQKQKTVGNRLSEARKKPSTFSQKNKTEENSSQVNSRIYGNQAIVKSNSTNHVIQRKCACNNQSGGNKICAECEEKNKRPQRKITIGASNDPFELEADQIADQVMTAKPDASTGPGNSPVRIQRLTHQSESQTDSVPKSVSQVLSESGRPLEPKLREDMEQRIGHDFSRVRVHSSKSAEQSARDINARAYTIRNDIVFGAGQFAPRANKGRQLLAHELVHVVQQSPSTNGHSDISDSVGNIQRQPATTTATPAPPSAPAVNTSATSPHGRNCDQANCVNEDRAVMGADLTRAQEWVDSAHQALSAQPLASETSRLLDWYFDSHAVSTVNTLSTRLNCISNSLAYARNQSWWGCDPPRQDANAYADMVSPVSFCAGQRDLICLTDNHFDNSSTKRSSTLIHEAAHLQGFSLGLLDNGVSFPDIYSWKPDFAFLTSSEALQNADSVAYFCRALATGVSPTVNLVIEAGAGFAASNSMNTWAARFFIGAEFQHPLLGLINPRLGIGLTIIGEPLEPSSTPRLDSNGALVVSALAGIRLTDPRPTRAGSGFVEFEAGPSAIIDSSVRPGAELGASVGYRWRMLDFSARLGTVLDPTNRDDESRAAIVGTAGLGGVF